MDIGLYVAVVRRHLLLISVGALIALLLAAVTTFSFSVAPPSMKWKLKPTFQVDSILLVTQTGFPVGRANLIQGGAPVDAAGALISKFADPSRYDYLASLYAQLATSDEVVKPVLGKDGFLHNGLLFLDGGKTVGSYTAAQLNDPTGAGTLPFIQIIAKASSAREALEIGQRVTSSLTGDLADNEKTSGIPAAQRVVMSVVQAPDTAREVKGRGLIIPMGIFILCLCGAFGLAFLVDNLKRSKTAASGEPGLDREPATVRDVAFTRPGRSPVARTEAWLEESRTGQPHRRVD